MRRVLGLVLACLLLTAACTSEGAHPRPSRSATTPDPSTPAPDLPDVASYVAIGDSFTSGPGLADLQEGAGLCLRSTRNWPSMLARELGVTTFEDESCIGAATHDVLRERAIPGDVVPAQLDAVRRDTELVTVGIGGNDGDLFTSLVSACTRQAGTCGSFAEDTAPAILDETRPKVVEVLGRIQDRAPDARVVLVGYLRILPTSGPCRKVPIPDADLDRGAGAEKAIDAMLAAAAEQAGVEYVSLRAVSEGHDACAGARAWTNGDVVSDDDGVAFHPRLAGMKAVARTVAARLASG